MQRNGGEKPNTFIGHRQKYPSWVHAICLWESINRLNSITPPKWAKRQKGTGEDGRSLLSDHLYAAKDQFSRRLISKRGPVQPASWSAITQISVAFHFRGVNASELHSFPSPQRAHLDLKCPHATSYCWCKALNFTPCLQFFRNAIGIEVIAASSGMRVFELNGLCNCTWPWRRVTDQALSDGVMVRTVTETIYRDCGDGCVYIYVER